MHHFFLSTLQSKNIKPVFVSLLLGLICFLQSPKALAGSLHQDAALGYMNAGQWSLANYEWRKALEENPKDIPSHLGLVRSLMQSGLQADAISHLEQTRKQFSDHRLDIELARAYQQVNQTLPAIHLYYNVLKNNHYHLEAFAGLNQLKSSFPAPHQTALMNMLQTRADEATTKATEATSSGDYARASRFYEFASLYAPENIIVQNNYAMALLLSGQQEKANQVFKTLHPKKDLWQVHANAALSALSQGRTVEARSAVEKAIAQSRDNHDKAQLYNLLGYIQENSHHLTPARFAYEEAIQLDPKLEKAYFNLAYVLTKDYQYDQAADVYRRLLKKNPNNAKGWNKLGFVYELMDEPNKAKSAYRKAIELSPQERDAYYNLATLYKKLNKQSQADKILSQWMSLEFQRMETSTATKLSPEPHPLFEFVDVFFLTREISDPKA